MRATRGRLPMPSRISRWRWLTIFAFGNLVCWVVVAVVAGLLIGDEVDLGVETLIRERQATVVAAWEQVSERPSRTEPQTAPTEQAPVPTESQPARGGPSATIAWPTDATPSPTPRAQARSGVSQPSTPTPSSPSQTATPRPKEALVNSPLLMSDPPISNLVHLDAEMSRSAPGRAVQIRYQEATLNREVAAMLQRNPDLPYRDVMVDLKQDRVVVTGSVTVLGFEVTTEAVGTVAVEDCRPQMEVQSISIAGVLTPGFVKDEIKGMLLEALAWYPADYALCLEQIVLEETGATVYGHRR
jgi:hypothetical protein